MRLTTLLVFAVMLTACGQKGSLYLPAKNPPASPGAPLSQP